MTILTRTILIVQFLYSTHYAYYGIYLKKHESFLCGDLLRIREEVKYIDYSIILYLTLLLTLFTGRGLEIYQFSVQMQESYFIALCILWPFLLFECSLAVLFDKLAYNLVWVLSFLVLYLLTRHFFQDEITLLVYFVYLMVLYSYLFFKVYIMVKRDKNGHHL